jgi:hypothetical protein
MGRVGHIFTIKTSNLGPGSDTFLYLFDTDGYTVLAWDDEGGDEEHASKIVFSPTGGVTYYVEVSHYRLSGTGSYDLSVTDEGSAPPDDHGNTPETATLVLSGTPVAGEIETPGDVDFFRFSAHLGNFYDVETFGLSSESDTFIKLYDKDGFTVLATDDQAGRETNASRIVWRGASGDSYYLSVAQFLSGATGGYNVRVTDLDSPISATPDGTQIFGTIQEPGDVEIFTFAAVQGRVYEIRLSDVQTGGFRLVLLDTDGLSEMTRSLLGTPEIDFDAPKSADYYVIVREDVSGGSYRFSIKDTGLPFPDADFNHDGEVNGPDLYLFMKVWHSPVPTPP